MKHVNNSVGKDFEHQVRGRKEGDHQNVPTPGVSPKGLGRIGDKMEANWVNLVCTHGALYLSKVNTERRILSL